MEEKMTNIERVSVNAALNKLECIQQSLNHLIGCFESYVEGEHESDARCARAALNDFRKETDFELDDLCDLAEVQSILNRY